MQASFDGSLTVSARRISEELGKIFRSAGLKVATQKYEYHAAGNIYQGENVYSILHAPRGDATEAIVLVAAWRNMDRELNQGGVALVLTLARYFKSMCRSPLTIRKAKDFRMVIVVQGHYILDHP